MGKQSLCRSSPYGEISRLARRGIRRHPLGLHEEDPLNDLRGMRMSLNRRPLAD